MEGNRAETGAPAGFVVVKLGAAHALHTTGDDNIGVVGLHQHGGVQDGLQAGGATPVQLVAGHLDGQARLESSQPPDGGVFAGGIAVAEDDVIDERRVYAATLQGSLDDGGSQLGGGDVAQAAAEVTDGGADWGNDGYSSH